MYSTSKLQPLPSHRITGDTPTNEKIQELWLHGKSRHTQDIYRRTISRLAIATDNKPLAWLTLEDVQLFCDRLEAEKLSDSSRRTYISAIKSLLSFASKCGLINFNVGASIKPPMAKDKLSERILDRGELNCLLDANVNERNKLILKLFYYGGLRVSELINLTWKDLNGEYLNVFGKGSKTRTIRLPVFLVAELKQFKPSEAKRDDYLFISVRTKSKLRRESVTQLIKAIAVDVGIDKPISSHTLRHCHATNSLEKGAPISLVKETLGHSSVAVTSRYLHVRPTQSSSLFL
ncbi:MAG: tyrosine-type recombinase/integrase [Hydrococcus sp. CRU_1_1]|nr:tyrosine-type recombinase/integrase [Hydrococcus sp. CRU_1_1]